MTKEEVEVWEESALNDDSPNGTAHIVINEINSSAEEDNEKKLELEMMEIGNDNTKEATRTSTADSSSSDPPSGSDYPLPIGDVTCCCRPSLLNSPLDLCKLTWGWLKTNRPQYLSGVTVALAQVPEAVSFSFVAGVDPIVGLQSAWIMGICTSLFGGRPGMVAGSTGAVAVVLPKLVSDYGVGYMFYAIILAGLIQMAFGFLRLGVLIRMVPHPVMVGFCNGLGIVIGTAQFNIFKVRPDEADAGGERRERSLLEIGGAFAPFTNGYPWVDPVMGGWMAFQIFVTLVTYVLFPKLTKIIPGSLAAIMMSTIVEWAFIRQIGYETITVADLASVSGSFPVPVWLDQKYGYAELMPPLNGKTVSVVFPTALTVAAIGLLESLLTLQLIDELTNTKGNGNREAVGQGLGNFLSGILGGMGGCTTIGQSLMNIHSGGFTRLSSSVAAVFMLLIILVAYPLINLIPVASLAGVMFVVTYFTIEWESGWVVLGSCLPQKLRQKYGLYTKVKRSDVFVMLIVVAVTLIFDLAIAVGAGILVSCLVFAWDAGTRLHLERAVSDDQSKVFYTVSGPIFFGSVKPLMELFPDPQTEPKDVIVLLEQAEVYDWSGMVAIKALHERFENNGATAKFQALSVSSHSLMMKGAHLWEGVNVYKDAELEFENDPHISNHLHVQNAY